MTTQIHLTQADTLVATIAAGTATSVVSFGDVRPDGNVNPDRQLASFSSADEAPVICGAPSGSVLKRMVKSLIVCNTGDEAEIVTVKLVNSGDEYVIGVKEVAAGETWTF